MFRARSLPLFAAAALLALPASGRGRPAAANGTLTYKPTKEDGDRPVVAKATIHPKANDFALQLDFTKPPMGPECKSRCANAVLLIDTDDDDETGMQQGRNRAPTGADISIFVQGIQDYGDSGKAASFLRVKIRQLSSESRIPEDGELLSDLDSRYEKERLEVDGKEVRIVIDASSGLLPQGKTCRLIYAPPNAKPVVAKCKGMGGEVPVSLGTKSSSTKSSSDVTVIKGTSHGANRSRARETEPDTGRFVTPKKVPPPAVDPRWGAGG